MSFSKGHSVIVTREDESENRTVFTAGCLTGDQVLIGVITAVIISVTEIAASHTDIRRRALVAARRTSRRRTVQLVRPVTVAAVVSLVTHLTTYTAQLSTLHSTQKHRAPFIFQVTLVNKFFK